MSLSRVSILLAVPVVLVVACRTSAAPEAHDPLALQVLVELRVDAAATGADRERAIRQAGEQLELALRGAGIAYEVVRRYGTIPWLALRISAASRERVAALPEVASLREDRVERTQPGGGT